MKEVWRLDKATARDVYEALREKRSIAYTTVMTMMKILGALLAFADEPTLFPATRFARRRHLFHRMLLISGRP